MWRAAAEAFGLHDFPNEEPVGGLDLSGTRDLTALAIFWPGGVARAAVEFWTPQEGLLDLMQSREELYDLLGYDPKQPEKHLPATH